MKKILFLFFILITNTARAESLNCSSINYIDNSSLTDQSGDIYKFETSFTQVLRNDINTQSPGAGTDGKLSYVNGRIYLTRSNDGGILVLDETLIIWNSVIEIPPCQSDPLPPVIPEVKFGDRISWDSSIDSVTGYKFCDNGICNPVGMNLFYILGNMSLGQHDLTVKATNACCDSVPSNVLKVNYTVDTTSPPGPPRNLRVD